MSTPCVPGGRSDGEKPGWTRRDLLKWTGLAACGVLAGALSPHLRRFGGLWRRQMAVPVDAWHKGVCRFCGTGCGVQIGTNGGRIVDVKGDPYAHNRGRLCIKGILNRDLLYARDRLLYPMVRAGGALRRATWDEAMQEAAGRFRETIGRRGPDAVAFYGSGQLFTQESYAANKLFKAGIGTNNVDGNPRLCMASAAAGYVSVFGKDEPPGCYEDIDEADCLLLVGANMADCHPVLWERVLDRKRSHPSTFLIAVDPRRTRTARDADLHLAIRPGTDVAFLNAMLGEFVRQDLVDRRFVARHVAFRGEDGERTFEDWVRHLDAYAPERAAEMCGVSADAIRRAAHRFGASRASMSLWTMGINQQVQGTAANRLLCALHLVTGQIGRPGATPFSLTGQPNAGGGVRDTGALAHSLPGGRLVENPEHRAQVEDLWGVSRGRISPRPGHHAVALFEAMAGGEVECALLMATNPAQSMPDLHKHRRGMERAFLVVADAFHPTETTRYADVLLPAALWAEKEGVFSQSERRYHLVERLVDAPGEARSDLDILTDLADRLGHGALFPARTPDTVWEEWRRMSAGTAYDFSGISYDRLRRERGLRWPCPDETHPGTRRRYVPGEDPLAKGDGPLDFYARPDRRAVVWLHRQEEPTEPPDDAYPLTLTTGRVLEHWHTMTITGGIPALDGIRPDFVEIHPLDARRAGVSEGDGVTIRSRRGEASLRARVTDDIRPGTVFATFHSARHLVNCATSDAHDPISRQPAFKRCAVSVERTP